MTVIRTRSKHRLSTTALFALLALSGSTMLTACGASVDVAESASQSSTSSSAADNAEEAADADTAGDFRTVEVSMSEATNMAATVSPNGTTVVMDLYSALWTVPVEGGQATRITEHSLEATRPTYSPHGDLIAFQAYQGGNYQIWVVRPDGTGLRQLTEGEFDHREPAWSPDGKEIVFSSDRSGRGSYDIWTMDVSDGTLTQHTHSPAEEYEPAWSPDGKEIVFTEGQGTTGPQVVVIDEKGTRRTVAEDASAPSWSPDGSSILYWQGGNLILNGEEVTSQEDVFRFPARALSQELVLYSADGGIRTRNLRTGEKVEIPFEANVELKRPVTRNTKDHQWSSDKPRQVTGILNPRLSPDGKTIAFGALNDLWLQTEGEKPKQLTDDQYWEYDVEWSRDGASVTYSSDKAGTPDVYLRDLATGEERRLTSAEGAEYGASLSPDGTRLSFLDQDNRLQVLDVASGKIHDLGTGPGGELWEGTSWSADGAYIALGDGSFAPNTRFREDFNSIWVVDSRTGERTSYAPQERGSIADLGDSGPVWSPDGKWMAFIMESSLWVLPVDPMGKPVGQARRITDETADSPSWSGDSSRLLYLHEGKLKSTDLEGTDVREHPVDLTYTNDVPQGRTVIHAGKMWDGTSQTARENIDITLDGDRIQSIDPHQERSEEDKEADTTYIDASNKTAVPGMFEMHSHPQDMRYYGTKWWNFYLSMGVTSNVSMGSFLYEAVSTREALASGELLGPRSFVAGELIDGSRVSHPETRAIVSDEQLEKELSRQQSLDPDLFKTYVRTAPEHMARVAEVANEVGVPAFSHILPTTATLGLTGTSHLGATQRAGYDNVTSPGGHSYGDVIDIYSKGGVDVVATPFEATALLGLQPELAHDPRVQRLLPAKDIATVEAASAQRPSSEEIDEIRGSMGVYTDLVRAGANVSAGTDAPLTTPGIHNHLVLRAFVEGGMTEVEALQTATSVAAETMGVAEDLGTLEVGKIADMVFVDGDPLMNINDLVNIEAVMKGGTYITQEQILDNF